MVADIKSKEEEAFVTRNGKKIRSLKELRDFLIIAPEDVLNHHINDHRNDFESWVRHALGNHQLADELVKERDPRKIAKIIDYYLSKIEFQKDRNDRDAAAQEGAEEKKGASTGNKKYLLPTNEAEDAELAKEYVKTRIPGFDELITKGIPVGSSVLISGGPGTGKTTFCLQLLKEAAENNEKCLYLTFEEDVSRLKHHMTNYNWNPERLEKEGRLIIKKMQPFELSRSVEALLAKASGELAIELDEIEGIIPRGFKPDKIVLDSLSAVAAAFIGKEEGYRIYIEQLFNLFKNLGATSFLVAEIEQETSRYSRSGIEEFLADAVFVFYNIRQKNIRLNALEILKIRGTSHQKKIVPFRIVSNQGIIVYPREEVFT